ncbi:MAG: hypothetical protein L0H84_00890 [Pseudonocardia sp.]|nr:hypothetical protein [Pseudonocardia sp.]
MALKIVDIIDEVASHAARLGQFERVAEHEPENVLASGLTFAVWMDRLGPVPSSGLSSTSGRLVLFLRIYSAADAAPADEIDPRVTAAADALMRAYVGDFTLGGIVRQVDVRGTHGVSLEARAGYLDSRDGAFMRVVTITLPLIINDLWPEEE